MKKICYISCCAECPAYRTTKDNNSFCGKQNRNISVSLDEVVDPALIGFPEWCPLPSEESSSQKDFTKVIRKIEKILEDDTSVDAYAEASHYLNSVLANVQE